MTGRRSVLHQVAAGLFLALCVFGLAVGALGLLDCSAAQRRNERLVIHLADDACILVEATTEAESVCIATSVIRAIADELLAAQRAAAAKGAASAAPSDGGAP